MTPPSPLTLRAAVREDAAPMAALLNAIIAVGGTTAHQEPFTADAFRHAYVTGPDALLCVAAEDAAGVLCGFQTVTRHAALPAGWGDMGTFSRQSPRRPGVGAALFAETTGRSRALGLVALNATIRADNAGGLAYYANMGFQDYAVDRAAPLGDGRRVDRISKRFLL